MQMHGDHATITRDYTALDKQQQFLSKGSSKDLCDCRSIATLNYIPNMRKASSTEPIPNTSMHNARPGVLLINETLGAPVVYQNVPSSKTDKSSGDDELSEIMLYIQGQDNVIAQLQMI